MEQVLRYNEGMAFVIPFQEGPSPDDVGFEGVLADAPLGGLGATYKDVDKSVVPAIATSHTELSRLQWLRSLIAKALAGKNYRVKVMDEDVSVELLEPIDRTIVPWSKSSQDLSRASLFSTNSKMRCPTFDLPSGIGALGGSCPGAYWAQSVVSAETLAKGKERKRWAEDVALKRRIDVQTAVCQSCYASGGSYGYTSTQFRELLIMGFMRSMLDAQNGENKEGSSTPSSRERLVRLFVHAVTKTLTWSKQDVSLKQGTRRLKPIRVHSSGDFFSTAYIDFWMEVARRVQTIDPDIIFWAPTRTHVIKEFAEHWKRIDIPTNFTIRASGYHVGDPAPAKVHPKNAEGTSVLSGEETEQRLRPTKGYANRMDGVKADHQCGVYSLGAGAKTCALAQGPNNSDGCRACWTHPHLRINYAIH